MSDFKPMLAATITAVEKLVFPLIVSPKLDGLRCMIRGGKAVSRNLLPFRNNHVQRCLAGLPDGLDGELIVGSPVEGHVLNRTQSGIMSGDGAPLFTYWLFDDYISNEKFYDRWWGLQEVEHPQIAIVPHYVVASLEELLQREKQFLDLGYEGLMTRSITGPYKHGRATLNEGYLGKLKRFRDGEAMVLDIEEGTENLNQQTRDELGRAKRSTHQENMVPNGMVGTIIAKDLQTAEIMRISPGRMPHDERDFYWKNPHRLVGQIVKYKTFDYGKLDASRFNTFQAFRSDQDMST